MWPFNRKYTNKKVAVLDCVTYSLGKPVLYEIRMGIEMHRVSGESIVDFMLRHKLATIYSASGDEALYLDYDDAIGKPFAIINVDKCVTEFI